MSQWDRPIPVMLQRKGTIRMLKPGEKKGVAREVSFYFDKKKNLPMVAVRLEITEPEPGEIIYRGDFGVKYAGLTGRDLRALGWCSDDLAHAKAEIEALGATIPFTIEHAEYTKTNGEKAYFPVVRNIGQQLMPTHSDSVYALAARGAAMIAESEKKFGKSPTPNTDESAGNEIPF